MKYDDASWHYGGDFPKNSPIEFGGTHIALFLKWCFSRDFAGEIHRTDSRRQIDAVIAGELTATEFFFSFCDGKFTDDDLNSEGNAFAETYFGGGDYFDDYAALFTDEVYEIGEEGHDFQRLAELLDQRYAEFKAEGS